MRNNTHTENGHNNSLLKLGCNSSMLCNKDLSLVLF